jgi:hypothetical protein
MFGCVSSAVAARAECRRLRFPMRHDAANSGGAVSIVFHPMHRGFGADAGRRPWLPVPR